MARPGSASRAPGRLVLTEILVVHSRSLTIWREMLWRCSRTGERDACITMPLARRIGSSEKTNARFRCLKATAAGFSAPSRNSWQADAILSLCETGGSGHVDRHVCRDDCLAQRHRDVAGGGVQEPTAARRRVIVQHRAVIARRSRANASYRDQFAHAR